MLTKRDEIYKSDGLYSSRAQTVLFPILLTINRTNCELALTESQRVITQLQQEISKHQLPEIDLCLCDFTVAYDGQKVQINLVREGKNSIHLQIEFFCVLSLSEKIDFWEKNVAISRCTDFLQSLCEQ